MTEGQTIARELASIPNPKAREAAEAYLQRIRNGERDLREGGEQEENRAALVVVERA